MIAMAAGPAAAAGPTLRPYASVGATSFSGDYVHSSTTGFGIDGGVDWAGRYVALGVRADASYLGQGDVSWVDTYVAQLRAFFGHTPWRPFAEVGLGFGGGSLSSGPFYALEWGGGLLNEQARGPAVFADVRSVTLGHMEGSGPSMVMFRFGMMVRRPAGE